MDNTTTEHVVTEEAAAVFELAGNALRQNLYPELREFFILVTQLRASVAMVKGRPRDRQDAVGFRLAAPERVKGYAVVEVAFFTPGGPGFNASALAVTQRGATYSTHLLQYDDERHLWYLENGHYGFTTLSQAQADMAKRNQNPPSDGPRASASETPMEEQKANAGKPPRTRQRIAGWVKDHPGSTPTDIAAGLGLGADQVKQSCRRMARDGQLRSTPGGTYYRGTVTVSPEVG
jgi:hypothetical protein